MQGLKAVVRSSREDNSGAIWCANKFSMAHVGKPVHDHIPVPVERDLGSENNECCETPLSITACPEGLTSMKNSAIDAVAADIGTNVEPLQKCQFTQTSSANGSKSKKGKGVANPASITPTVILNGLAMSRGERVTYQVTEKVPLQAKPVYDMKSQPSPVSNLHYGIHNGDVFDLRPRIIKRWIYPYLFRMLVTVGDRSFSGEGKSRQAARHSAARAALEVLQSMPIPKQSKEKKILSSSAEKGGQEGDSKDSPAKSKVSILYEMVSSSKLRIDFKVISDTGPPHLKLFTTRVTIYKGVSETILSAEGTGHSKSSAKASAAEAALEIIKDNPLPGKKQERSSNKNMVDARLASILSSNALHPSSRLSQIMQAQKKTAPVYSIVSSNVSNPQHSSFTTQCTVDGQTVIGHGRSKKDSKRDASEKMLSNLGFHLSQSPMTNGDTPSPMLKATAKNVGKTRSRGTGIDILPPVPEV